MLTSRLPQSLPCRSRRCFRVVLRHRPCQASVVVLLLSRPNHVIVLCSSWRDTAVTVGDVRLLNVARKAVTVAGELPLLSVASHNSGRRCYHRSLALSSLFHMFFLLKAETPFRSTYDLYNEVVPFPLFNYRQSLTSS